MENQLNSSALIFPVESAPTSVAVARPLGTLLCLAVSDILAIITALAAASALRNRMMPNPGAPLFGTILAALILTLCSLLAAGLYPGVCINPIEELRRCTLSITLSFLSLWSVTFFLHDLSKSRLVYALAYLLALSLVPVFRACMRSAFCTKSWWGCQVAILGFGETGKLLLQTLNKNPAIGLRPFAVLDDDHASYADLNTDLICGPLSRCVEITQEHKISYGIICMPGLSRHDLLRLLDLYGPCFSHVLVIPNLVGMSSLGICAREVGGIVGLEVPRQLLRPSARITKRLLDLAITLVLAPLVVPIVLLCAILIRLEGPGPIFYANERVGCGGRRFRTWKLRSMLVDGDEVLARYLTENPNEAAHWRATQKLKSDPRITRVGKILRKASIDELPQLWNVLIGEMSVVGPRPVLASQIQMYGSGFNLYKQVRPGITGLWQVSGRNELSFSERVKLDKYVIQNWSVWLDLYVIARTVGVVLRAKGAY